MNDIFSKLTKGMTLFPGVSEEEINIASSSISYLFPDDYKKFFKFSNGARGIVGNNFLQIWPLENIRSYNEKFSVDLYTPGLLLFGSNGGGEGYGFDYRGKAIVVVMVPYVDLDWEYAIKKGDSFIDFLERLNLPS
jgi:hypothetical protein